MEKILLNKSYLFSFVFVSLIAADIRGETKYRELQRAFNLLFDDVNLLKQKVLVELAAQVDILSEKLDEYDRHSNYLGIFNDTKICPCETLPAKKESVVQKMEENVKDLIKRHDQISKTVLKAFSDEKLTIKTQHSEVGKLITMLHKENEQLKHMLQRTHEQNTLTDIEIGILQETVAQLKAADVKSKEEIETLVKKHHGRQVDRTLKTFGKPSFVSEWIFMESQNPYSSRISIEHKLGAIPSKVDVQIRPTSGPNAGYIFPGESVFQSDDDVTAVYGGIVYLYNESHVSLHAPIRANDNANGVIIHTGSGGHRRLGNNHQSSKQAFVRVKIWAADDMPVPDFESKWLPLNLSDSRLAYNDIKHGFDGYPAQVSVQIRCHENGGYLISDGAGASIWHNDRHWSSNGGVVWGFNDVSVRVWAAYLNTEVRRINSMQHYRLFGGGVDGWGGTVYGVYAGEFRVLAWSQNLFITNLNMFERSEKNIKFAEWYAFEKGTISSDDLLTVYTQAEDGENKGYRFVGYGNSQAQIVEERFGGIVYAYHPGGNLRLWRPNPSAGGHLIHINSPYGNGMNVQASNNASYIATLIKAWTGDI